MIILGPLIEIIVYAIQLYVWLVIASAIVSWLVAFNVINTRNQFVYAVANFLYRITEPAIRPIRRFVPAFGGIDISPVILILILFFLQKILINVLVSLQGGMGY